MKTIEMTSTDLKHYGIEESDLPDIWVRFDEFKQEFLVSSGERQVEDEQALRIVQDEARAEAFRDNQMEQWAMEGEEERIAQREIEMKAVRAISSDKDKGLEQ